MFNSHNNQSNIMTCKNCAMSFEKDDELWCMHNNSQTSPKGICQDCNNDIHAIKKGGTPYKGVAGRSGLIDPMTRAVKMEDLKKDEAQIFITHLFKRIEDTNEIENIVFCLVKDTSNLSDQPYLIIEFFGQNESKIRVPHKVELGLSLAESIDSLFTVVNAVLLDDFLLNGSSYSSSIPSFDTDCLRDLAYELSDLQEKVGDPLSVSGDRKDVMVACHTGIVLPAAISPECWAAQIEGFMACQGCPLKNTDGCISVSLIKEGYNLLGWEIPLTSQRRNSNYEIISSF